jgi:hypothetical protein
MNPRYVAREFLVAWLTFVGVGSLLMCSVLVLVLVSFLRRKVVESSRPLSITVYSASADMS